MRLLLPIAFFVVPMSTYYLGFLRADRSPSRNHKALARWSEKVLIRDSQVPILSREEASEGNRLLDGFHALPVAPKKEK